MEQLAFETIEGWHTGKNIASILTHTVNHYELNGKVKQSSLFNYLIQTELISKNHHRLVGLPLMVPQSMVPPFMSLKPKLTLPMMVGQLRNMTYCMYTCLLLDHSSDCCQMHGTFSPPCIEALCWGCGTCLTNIHLQEGQSSIRSWECWGSKSQQWWQWQWQWQW